MDRTEKIDALVEVLDDNNIKIIETSTIQGLIIDAQFNADEYEDEYEYDELLDKGLVPEDIVSLREFFESAMWMLVKVDEVQGVSFDNVELSIDMLYESDLWKEKDEE